MPPPQTAWQRCGIAGVLWRKRGDRCVTCMTAVVGSRVVRACKLAHEAEIGAPRSVRRACDRHGARSGDSNPESVKGPRTQPDALFWHQCVSRSLHVWYDRHHILVREHGCPRNSRGLSPRDCSWCLHTETGLVGPPSLLTGRSRARCWNSGP